MNKALQGDWRCFDHILDIAYGRKGKLKHELIEVCPYTFRSKFAWCIIASSHFSPTQMPKFLRPLFRKYFLHDHLFTLLNFGLC